MMIFEIIRKTSLGTIQLLDNYYNAFSMSEFCHNLRSKDKS